MFSTLELKFEYFGVQIRILREISCLEPAPNVWNPKSRYIRPLKRNLIVNKEVPSYFFRIFNRIFTRKIDSKLPEKQRKTPPNTPLMPPLKNRK